MHTVQIPDEVGKLLSELAIRTHKSESFYATQALAQLLEDEEDYRLAMEVLEKNEPTIPWEEVKKQLGLEDEKLEN